MFKNEVHKALDYLATPNHKNNINPDVIEICVMHNYIKFKGRTPKLTSFGYEKLMEYNIANS